MIRNNEINAMINKQKKEDIFPNNSLIGVDKCQQVWYNVNMIKNTTKKERKNLMNKKENYFGFNPELFNKTATHIYNGVKVRVYKTYTDTGCATILEGPNKGKVTTVYFDKATKV